MPRCHGAVIDGRPLQRPSWTCSWTGAPRRPSTTWVARTPELAEQRLSVLLARYPDHRHRRAAEALCNALARLSDPRPRDPAGEVAFLETHLEPLARELLGRGAREFLAPFWRRAAEALKGQPFDPERDHLHASWAFFQCRDWQAVIESLADAPEEGLPSLLVGRRAALGQERATGRHPF